MSALLEVSARELERPRNVSPQVVNHLIGTYGLNREAIGSFLAQELAKLEDFEVELILSPLFTPTLLDQSVFAELLGANATARDQWPRLIQQLVDRPTHARLITEDQHPHGVPLREVILERYVHRLRLDGTIPEPTFKLISYFPSAADRPLLKAIARRGIWEADSRQEILVRYLLNANPGAGDAGGDAAGLLKLMETYEPANLNDLLAQIPHWQRVLQQEINDGTGAKPFFNERVEELHGGGRDQRRREDARLNAKQEELAFLQRLQRALNS